MPLYHFVCRNESCGYREERVTKVEERSYDCPSCGDVMERVWLKAPMTRIGGEGSDRQIESMKRSFNEHFVGHEMDDIRHKHGRLFDESLASAAARRIKDGSA
jgi:putative FmdB family regulatory protein